MKSIGSIVARNMKVIYRSKLSFILLVLAPILIVFLVGTAFSSSSLNNIRIGVYSDNYSELTEDILSDLSESNFLITKKESADICVNSIKQGSSHVCIIFPADISVDGSNDEIEIYLDNSRLNIAYVLINQINSEISSKGAEIGISAADDLLKVIGEVKQSLPNQKSGLDGIKQSFSSIDSQTGSLSSSSNEAEIEKLDDALKKIDSIQTDSDLSSLKSNINFVKSSLSSQDSEMQSVFSSVSSESSSGRSKADELLKEVESISISVSLITADDAEKIVLPIKTEVKPIGDDTSNWINLFPTLVALVILLSSLVLASSVVLTERRAKAKFRNFMSPTSDFSFLLGAYITGFIILTLQLIIFFSGSFYLTGINIFDNFWSTLLILFFSISIFLFIGMFIGYLFKSDETTLLTSISIASVLIFFSNAIIPIESIKGNLRYFAMYNPLSIVDSLLKKSILFGEPFSSLQFELLLLAGMFVVLMMLTLFARKLTKKWV